MKDVLGTLVLLAFVALAVMMFTKACQHPENDIIPSPDKPDIKIGAPANTPDRGIF